MCYVLSALFNLQYMCVIQSRHISSGILMSIIPSTHIGKLRQVVMQYTCAGIHMTHIYVGKYGYQCSTHLHKGPQRKGQCSATNTGKLHSNFLLVFTEIIILSVVKSNCR